MAEAGGVARRQRFGDGDLAVAGFEAGDRFADEVAVCRACSRMMCAGSSGPPYRAIDRAQVQPMIANAAVAESQITGRLPPAKRFISIRS